MPPPARSVPHLLLTRPRAQAERLATQIRARWPGLGVTISPLLEIALHPPRPDVADEAAGLIFTSENGVAGFAAGCPGRALPAWCVGPRTAQAARDAGFTTLHVAGGDAQSLLALLQRMAPPGPLLHLRGQHAARAIASDLRAAGIAAREQVVYDQEARPLDPAAQALLERPGDVIAPLFSPRTARLFAAALRRIAVQARLHPVAISAAAAQPLEETHPETLKIAAKPDAQAVIARIAEVIHALETDPNPR